MTKTLRGISKITTWIIKKDTIRDYIKTGGCDKGKQLARHEIPKNVSKKDSGVGLSCDFFNILRKCYNIE